VKTLFADATPSEIDLYVWQQGSWELWDRIIDRRVRSSFYGFSISVVEGWLVVTTPEHDNSSLLFYSLPRKTSTCEGDVDCYRGVCSANGVCVE
jgi:hypothetical protein